MLAVRSECSFNSSRGVATMRPRHGSVGGHGPCSLSQPLGHSVLTPGIPSRLRLRCPPRRPIHSTAWPMVNSEGVIFPPKWATNVSASSALSTSEAGASGVWLARSRNDTIRAAAAALMVTAFSNPSHVSNRRSSTRQPLLSTKCTSSTGHRHVYFRTTSSASAAVAAGSSVQSSQWTGSVPAAVGAPAPRPDSRSSARRADISPGRASNPPTSTALAPPPNAAEYPVSRSPARSPRSVRAGSAPPRTPWPAGRRSGCSGHSG